MPDAMVLLRVDGVVTTTKQHQQGSTNIKNNNGIIKKLGSSSSNSEVGDDDDYDDGNDNEEDDVPVLDLFAGSFEANFVNFDVFESSDCGSSLNSTLHDNGNPFELDQRKIIGVLLPVMWGVMVPL